MAPKAGVTRITVIVMTFAHHAMGHGRLHLAQVRGRNLTFSAASSQAPRAEAAASPTPIL